MKPLFEAKLDSTSTHEGLPNPRKTTAEYLLRIGIAVGVVCVAGLITLYAKYPFEKIGKLLSDPSTIGIAEVTAFGSACLLVSLLVRSARTIIKALGDRVDRIFGTGPSSEFASLSHVVSAIKDPAKARLAFSRPLSFLFAGGAWEDKSARLSPNHKLIAASLIGIAKSTGTLAVMLLVSWTGLIITGAIAKGANPELGQKLTTLASGSMLWMTAMAAILGCVFLVLAIRGIVQQSFLSDPVTRLTDSMSGKLEPELLPAWMRRATDHLASDGQPNRVHVLATEAAAQSLSNERAAVQSALFVESPVSVREPDLQPHARKLIMWGASLLVSAAFIAIAANLFRPQNVWILANLFASALVLAIVGNWLFRSGDRLLSLWRFSSTVIVINATGVASRSSVKLGNNMRDEQVAKDIFDGELVVRLFAAQVVSESLPLGRPRELVGFEATSLDPASIVRVIEQLRSQITSTTSFVTADRGTSAPLHVLNQALAGSKGAITGIDSNGQPLTLFAPAAQPTTPLQLPAVNPAPSSGTQISPEPKAQVTAHPSPVNQTIDLLQQLLAEYKSGKISHPMPAALIESKILISQTRILHGESSDVVQRELIDIMTGFK